MSPLSLSGPVGEQPADFVQLLDALSSRAQPAVIFYGSDDSRVELSGRVLANWAVKLVGLFSEEYELSPGDLVVVNAAPHWKAAAVILAAGAMGADVTLKPGGEVDLVVTDRPNAWIDSPQLGGAELAALSGGMLDASFEEATGESIPAWVLDISADVRQQPDQLLTPLSPVALPETGPGASGTLVINGWNQDAAAQLVSTWARHEVVVIFQGEPSGRRWDQMRRNEGLD